MSARKTGSVSRRQMLRATGVGLAAGVAGCTGQGGQQTTAPPEETTAPGMEETETGMEYVQPGDSGGEVHILTDYSNDAWQVIWEDQLVPAFQDELGVDTNVEYMGFQGTGEERLTTLLQAGEAPETFTCSPFQLGDMFANGQLAWTTHVVDHLTERLGDLVGSPLEFFGREKTRVPHGQYTDTWNFRVDVLEELGLEIPESNEELLHNAQVIDESDEFEQRGATVSAVKSGQSASMFEGMMQLKGVWYFRWKDDESRDEAEVWFPKQEIVEALEFYRDLAEYSPDPSSVDWGSTLGFWAGDRVAQMYHLNGWPAGVAANAGETEIAENTDITPFLDYEEGGDDSLGRGNPGFDGHPAISIADNVAGWFTILQYMYGTPERAAQYYVVEPTRFVPAFRDIMDTDEYKNADIFQQVPKLLDLNIQARDEIAPLEPSSGDLAVTPASAFAQRFPILSEMTNQVVVQGRDPENAWEEAHGRYEQRLQQGKDLVEENF